MRKYMLWIIIFLFMLLISPSAQSETFYYQGGMSSSIEVEWLRSFEMETRLKWLEIQIAEPTSYESGFNQQIIRNFAIEYSLAPTSTKIERDSLGNKFHIIRWEAVKVAKVDCIITYTADQTANLKADTLSTPFPMANLDESLTLFLEPSTNVQSNAQEIAEKARYLTKNDRTEYEAVTSILNWVVSNVFYVYDPPNRDAIEAFDTGEGNCENYANLACAMLRAVGIPARVAGGLSIQQPWSVETKRGTLTQEDGMGRHAWLEVYYPEIGWAAHDPQRTFLFINTHLIRNSYGVDVEDFTEQVRAIPCVPYEDEYITPTFRSDRVAFKIRDEKKVPGNYIVSGFVATGEQPEDEPKKMTSATGNYSKYYNKRFANKSESLFVEGKDEYGFDVKIKERRSEETYRHDYKGQITDKYVTASSGQYARSYAQAVAIDFDFDLEEIHLLMHDYARFPGKIWLELREDNNGVPATDGLKSQELATGGPHQAGYSWFKFAFPQKKLLKGASSKLTTQSLAALKNFLPDNIITELKVMTDQEYMTKEDFLAALKSTIGETDLENYEDAIVSLTRKKYWIVMEHDGNAIVNWQGVWGNPYDSPDDTMSAAYRTNNWDTTVNMDFNFKLVGKKK